MKTFVVKTFETLAAIGFVLVVLAGAAAGWHRATLALYWGEGFPGGPLVGVVLGAAAGFVVAVVVFGLLFLLFDVAENTRRTREILEAEQRRWQAAPAR